jgi:hypothetical protein
VPHFRVDFTPCGPLVDVQVGISSALRAKLQQSGTAVPPHVSARLLLDTGASNTCLDAGIVAKLGLQPTGAQLCATPSHAAVSLPTYFVELVLSPLVTVEAVVLGARVSSQGIDGLLGRDLLDNAVVVYDGVQKHCTISF